MPQTRNPSFEQLQVDLFGLLHGYASVPDTSKAAGIASLLEQILRHPLIEIFPDFHRQCVKGLQHWRLRACEYHQSSPQTGYQPMIQGNPCTAH